MHSILRRWFVVSAFSVAIASADASAQALTGWRTVHMSDAYDFMVSLESVTDIVDADGLSPVRGVHLSRMLVRSLDATRSALIAERAREGLAVEGFESYASSTDVFWVKCEEGLVSIRQSIDFDIGGEQLDAREPAPVWEAATSFPDHEAVAAMMRWVCR